MGIFSIKFSSIVLILLGALTLALPQIASADTSWLIKKDSWSASDEKTYSEFVARLGESGCNTVDRCLKSPSNPYRKTDPAGSFFDADCAKFPYLLRGYFAWKNGLPFSYASGVRSADGVGGDIRYSPNGNIVTSRIAVVPHSAGEIINGYRALREMQNNVDSAMFRVHPKRDGVERGSFPDFVMVQVDRAAIHPGTMIYDAAGHVVIVYKIEADGRVRYFDAHPDKTVSHGVFGEKFARSRPGSGAGFKNFRSLRLSGAQKAHDGHYFGGAVTTESLSQTPGFSVEQFFGNENQSTANDGNWKSARFRAYGREMGWFDFVRARLAIGELKYHPVEELKNAMDSICGDIQDRVIAVQTSLAAGVQNKSHPDRLPQNIYGTEGEWEEYSSPSRDARLKTSFHEVRTRIEQMIALYQKNDPSVEYNGGNLRADLLAAYDERASACRVQYQATSGGLVTLSYQDVLHRLFALSFDPYMCAELRWGASDPGELASCPDSAEKHQWYAAEQRLRNQIDRPYDVVMGFSLHDLLGHVAGSGPERAPDVDLRSILSTKSDQSLGLE